MILQEIIPDLMLKKTFLIIIINVENINLFISLFFNLTTNV